uniref:Carboxypeptidase B2 n=1 Tax=Crocodylus porosus TaxID=8502 RepID=A0A7M4E0N0_CROPO
MFLCTLNALNLVIFKIMTHSENIKKDKEVHFFVNASVINDVKAELKQSTILYKVLMNNVQDLIEAQVVNDTVHPRSSVSYYEQYHSLKEINSWMDHITEKNADILQKICIGSSYEKRPLYVLKVQNKTPKNAIWIDCGIHAREWVAPAFCIWFIGHHRMWRKSRSRHANDRCIGTDMNRNFDAGWCGEGASDNSCQQTYCGPYPESEPEVMAVTSFLKAHKDNIKGYITIHSYSQMVLFPYSYTMNRSKDHDELQLLAKKAAAAIRKTSRKVYQSGPGAETIYLAPGGSDDWAYDLGIKYSFTFELRDKGTYGFLLPPHLIRPTCIEALSAVKEIASHIMINI